MTPRTSALEQLTSFLAGRPADNLEWFDLIRTANVHLVTPYLFPALTDQGKLEATDPEVLDYVKLVATRNGKRNAALWREAIVAARVLNNAGIEPLFIKGASRLAVADNPEKSPRVLIDVDLVIPEKEILSVKMAVERAGYVDLGGPVSAHSVGNFAREGDVGVIDIHWRLPKRIEEFLGWKHVLQSAERRVVEGASFLTPDPQTAQILNIAHEFLHDRGLRRGTTSLRYLLDLIEDSGAWAGFSEGPNSHRALSHGSFALAAELQMRMVDHLFGVKGVGIPRSRIGLILHKRRLMKIRSSKFDQIEQSLFWIRRYGFHRR